MRTFFIAAFATVAAATSFHEWTALHGKSYTSEEETVMRQAIYSYNLAKIADHNAKNLSWTMAPNKFADLTSTEFKARFASGLRAHAHNRPHKVSGFRGIAVPAAVDWVSAGAVTPVKNQGDCGSCWSFSTTGCVEGANFVANGQLVSLSEQQLVDCSGAEGNQGCNGGLMDDAFQYIIDNGGICSEAAYPYEGVQGTCKSTSCQSVVSIVSYTDVTPNSEKALVAAIAQQPVSIAVEADQSSFQFYSGGVMTAACGTNLDHGVLAVGYGTDAAAGGDYYKVKNSWGADWGESGYIRLGRGSAFGASGQCGIQMQPSYAIASSN